MYLSIQRLLKLIQIKKKVIVRRKDGSEIEDSYDELIISTGSSPLRPPIEGIDGKNVLSIWTVSDTDRIRKEVDEKNPESVVVVGGGFIGLEMAENLHKRGLKVHLVEASPQVMAPVDYEIAQMLHENMRDNDVDLRLGTRVEAFRDKNGKKEVVLSDGNNIETDLVIFSIGVRPNSQLAKEAGLELNERGGIIVDDTMQTSRENIWSVGDVIEVNQLSTGEKTMIPLAGPANKQGRIVANNIVSKAKGGKLEEYKGSLGTSIAQVFDYTIAQVGLNEKTLMAKGLKRNKDYFRALIRQKAHAGYYPMATFMVLKMLFTKDGEILGGQIVGQEGVDKRIDVLASTIRLKGTIYDLKELELAYAPPYSSAKDPVNMLGFVAGNILEGLVKFRTPEEIEEGLKEEKLRVVDVRLPEERLTWSLNSSINIPLEELRERYKEIPKDKEIAVLCAVGVRAYNGARILKGNGFENVSVVEGGANFYRTAMSQEKPIEESKKEEVEPKEHNKVNQASVEKSIDCSGLQCPGPIMQVNETLKTMEEGQILRVKATDMGFSKDVESWCSRTGNSFISSEKQGLEHIVTIQKGKEKQNMPMENPKKQIEEVAAQGKTMVVFDGDLDKALAAFIIANGAAAMGRPVTMFFTFWGLNILRKSTHVPVKKTLIEKMFGAMMPRGTKKLGLSRMNMAGMGTKLMKKVMQDKNVSSLEDLMQSAINNGVKIVACTMSMDVMGIKEEELIDGVELAGVASYLADAEASNVNLFI